MTNTNEWRMNYGTVPEGVGPDTDIEVEYRNGDMMVWDTNLGSGPNNDPDLWVVNGFSSLDIIRWRFV